MKIAKVSEDLLNKTFERWEVDNDFKTPIYNYLVHGFDPGSFFSSVIANDFLGAMAHSHPNNTIPALKRVSNWIRSYMPDKAYGSYDRVNRWISMPEEERRAVLEKSKLIYNNQQEMWGTLKA